MPDLFVPPTKFKTKKDFMDTLADMMSSSIEMERADANFIPESRGRHSEFKTYLMESNKPIEKISCSQISNNQKLIAEFIKTNLPSIGLLNIQVTGVGRTYFYVDFSDPRFLVLYTNDLAQRSDPIFKHVIQSNENKFDRVWIPTEKQEDICNLKGNAFSGFGLAFDDLFSQEAIDEQPIHELRMSVAGSSSTKALKALYDEKALRRSLAYSRIRLVRGIKSSYVTDEISYAGRVITKEGNSVDEHVSLIENIRKIYRDLIENAEVRSIGTKSVNGRTLIEGQAFDLNLERKIEDLDFFVDTLLNTKKPFRLWGLKNKITKDIRQVVAVDLHTGDPLDLEIASNLVRVYLPRGACGNVLLRLYVNLQHGFDSAIRFNEEKYFGTQ